MIDTYRDPMTARPSRPRRDLVEYVEGLRQASLIVAGGTAEE